MSSYIDRSLVFLVGGFFSLSLISCASTPPKPVATGSVISHPTTTPSVSARSTGGAYHTVAKGETLWRISKLYNVPVAAIKQANRIVGDSIDTGTRLFIPTVTGVGALADATVAQVGRVLSPAPAVRTYAGSEAHFLWPVRGRVATRFGVMEDGVTTKGIDIASPLNNPVVASKSGVVSFVSDSVKGYGKTIIIDHSSSFQTVYSYNNDILVTKGQRVRQGETIAHSGVSSRNQQPALHFEIRRGHQPVNPESLLR